MSLVEMLEYRERIRNSLEFIEAAERVCKRSNAFSPWFMGEVHKLVEQARSDLKDISERIRKRKKAIIPKYETLLRATEVDKYHGYT